MKTLAVILHYNTPQYTDVLYEMLEPDGSFDKFDLAVVDNGSDTGKESKYTSFKLDENVFFGGGLNACMEMVMESDQYDSLLFLNSDLIVGKHFVGGLRREFKKYQGSLHVGEDGRYDIVSPAILQPEKTQNHWTQMLPHGQFCCRTVEWIDLQCPLISKRFIQACYEENNKEYFVDPLLIRGWGIDVYWGILAKKFGWKTSVCDYTTAVHLGSATLKVLGNTNEYCQLAEQGMYEFFNKKGLMNEFTNMRKWAENYKE